MLPTKIRFANDTLRGVVDAALDLHLSRLTTIEVVERKEIDRLLNELADTGLNRRDLQVGYLLGAEVLVGGTLLAGEENATQLELTALETATGRVLLRHAIRVADEASVVAAVERFAAELPEALVSSPYHVSVAVLPFKHISPFAERGDSMCVAADSLLVNTGISVVEVPLRTLRSRLEGGGAFRSSADIAATIAGRLQKWLAENEPAAIYDCVSERNMAVPKSCRERVLAHLKTVCRNAVEAGDHEAADWAARALWGMGDPESAAAILEPLARDLNAVKSASLRDCIRCIGPKRLPQPLNAQRQADRPGEDRR